jgi:hypothetical protein
MMYKLESSSLEREQLQDVVVFRLEFDEPIPYSSNDVVYRYSQHQYETLDEILNLTSRLE